MISRTRTVALLGAGEMGRPMGENLVRAGHDVRAWDPRPERARSVDGADPVGDPAAAVRGADVVMTMAPDGPAVDQTMFGDGGVASEIVPGALWLQTSTIGPAWARRFDERANERAIEFVDAPVIGTTPQALSGGLYFFASAPESRRASCKPLLETMGTRIFWYENAGEGQRMKLVVNSWILTVITLAAESLALTQQLGLDPQQFMEILDGHPTGSPLLQVVGPAMLDHVLTGDLRLGLASKDLGLILDAADEVGFDHTLARAAHARLVQAVELGYADASVVAAYQAIRPEG
jgi:3-hydroxyisobutyrate dehydrogenase